MADNYKILNQSPNVALNPTGIGFQNVWTVSYQVTAGPSKGTVGSVEVPNEEHTASNIKSLIEAKIKSLDEIASL